MHPLPLTCTDYERKRLLEAKGASRGRARVLGRVPVWFPEVEEALKAEIWKGLD